MLCHSFDQRTRSRDQPPLTLTECEEMMLDIQEKYPVEYKTYGLSSVAVAIVFPLIKNYLEVSSHPYTLWCYHSNQVTGKLPLLGLC